MHDGLYLGMLKMSSARCTPSPPNEALASAALAATPVAVAAGLGAPSPRLPLVDCMLPAPAQDRPSTHPRSPLPPPPSLLPPPSTYRHAAAASFLPCPFARAHTPYPPLGPVMFGMGVVLVGMAPHLPGDTTSSPSSKRAGSQPCVIGGPCNGRAGRPAGRVGQVAMYPRTISFQEPRSVQSWTNYGGFDEGYSCSRRASVVGRVNRCNAEFLDKSESPDTQLGPVRWSPRVRISSSVPIPRGRRALQNLEGMGVWMKMQTGDGGLLEEDQHIRRPPARGQPLPLLPHEFLLQVLHTGAGPRPSIECDTLTPKCWLTTPSPPHRQRRAPSSSSGRPVVG